MAELTQEQVVAAVQEAINRHTFSDFNLTVSPEVTRAGDYWYVGIRAHPFPKNRFQLYEAFAELEEDLSEKQVHVLLTAAYLADEAS